MAEEKKSEYPRKCPVRSCKEIIHSEKDQRIHNITAHPA